MDKSVIVCFSEESANLYRLEYELGERLGENYKLITYQNGKDLYRCLNDNPESFRFSIIIIEIKEATADFIKFLDKINRLLPYNSKLIIAGKSEISAFQNQINSQDSVQYLKSPWSNEELDLALQATQNNYSLLQKYKRKKTEISKYKSKVEEEVTKRLQNLIDSNFAKDKFLSVISHDLKTPFAGLLGISEILTSDWENLSDEMKLDMVCDIRKTTEESYKLLENLLEWTKAQKEKLEVSINEIHIREIVESSIKVAENEANSKHIHIENKINEKLKVNADQNMISTVFRNLIYNAVKYTQPGGRINISATEQKNQCTFCVEDNGNGIDKPYILDIFALGNGKKCESKFRGIRGLGLYLCKEFVELNGGQIWLETQMGQGSKFYFTVPAH